MKDTQKILKINFSNEDFNVGNDNVIFRTEKELDLFIEKTKKLPLKERTKKVHFMIDFYEVTRIDSFNKLQYLILKESQVWDDNFYRESAND